VGAPGSAGPGSRATGLLVYRESRVRATRYQHCTAVLKVSRDRSKRSGRPAQAPEPGRDKEYDSREYDSRRLYDSQALSQNLERPCLGLGVQDFTDSVAAAELDPTKMAPVS
jgi:hypothetical protein